MDRILLFIDLGYSICAEAVPWFEALTVRYFLSVPSKVPHQVLSTYELTIFSILPILSLQVEVFCIFSKCTSQ